MNISLILKPMPNRDIAWEVEVRWQDKTESGPLIGEVTFAKTANNLSLTNDSVSGEYQAAVVTRTAPDNSVPDHIVFHNTKPDNFNIDSTNIKHTWNTISASATLRLIGIFAGVIILGILGMNRCYLHVTATTVSIVLWRVTLINCH